MATAAVRRPAGILRRPRATTGKWSWLTTVDHKKIGIMYCVTAFIFFLAGGVEALIIRAQLARPDGTVVSADAYNQIFTMHGLTMIFLVVMPLGVGIMNYGVGPIVWDKSYAMVTVVAETEARLGHMDARLNIVVMPHEWSAPAVEVVDG